MCALTIGLLLFPSSSLDSLWRLNPEAHAAFQLMGRLSILLMAIVGVACALAAIGLARNARWGRSLGILILIVNFVGDLTNAFVRHDLRTLIGVPIAGAMIFYLTREAKSKESGNVIGDRARRREVPRDRLIVKGRG